MFFFFALFYPVRMDNIVPLHAGTWKLFLAPKSQRSKVLTLIGRLAEKNSVLVLDGGNNFNAYHVARIAHGHSEILGRISISRAFTCYQMLSLLDATSASGETILLLDFLATFYDENVPFVDRSRLLKIALLHIQRLSRNNGLLVVVHPSAVPSPQVTQLVQYLINETPEVFISDATPKPPEPLRLF